MKTFIIVIVELLMFLHPIFELLKLKFSCTNIYVVTFENVNCKFLNHVVNVSRSNLYMGLPDLNFEVCAFYFTFFI